jgi:protein-tyrosine phosphatase
MIALEQGHNFRDIGGYETDDGRRIRRGRVFRSGTLALLTDDDQRQLAALGIKLICDFRTTNERRARPTRWLEPNLVDFWSRDHHGSVGELIAAMNHPDISADAIRERMLQTYRDLPFEQADTLREMFHRIAAGSLPMIFHCSVGKDRTGIAAALLLSALGVPREVVVSDYLVTEQFFEKSCRLVFADSQSKRATVPEREIWEPMMRADREYIETMFQTVTERHGSIDGYLRDVLGWTAKSQAALRHEMLAE